MSVEEGVRFFSRTDQGPRHKSYPIVEADGRLVGLVSRGDVLRWTLEGWSADRTLGDMVLRSSVLTGHPTEIVGRLADRMAAGDVGRVPIVDPADGRLVGIVARKDLLRVRAILLSQEQDREAVLRATRHRSAPTATATATGTEHASSDALT
jgi:CBS domain-containing protein